LAVSSGYAEIQQLHICTLKRGKLLDLLTKENKLTLQKCPNLILPCFCEILNWLFSETLFYRQNQKIDVFGFGTNIDALLRKI